jgi:hypothetical protein
MAKAVIPEHDWLTTYPSGKTHTHGADDGQTGWRLHAVPKVPAYGAKDDNNPRWKWRRALCGTQPGTGWGHDLFIEDECARCLKWLAKRGDKLAADALVRRARLSSSYAMTPNDKAQGSAACGASPAAKGSATTEKGTK